MNGKQAAGYFRVSQARDDMRAPELYTDEIQRYCAFRNLELGEIFSDIDFSGYRDAKRRPALESLKLRRYDFSMVIIPKLSRFGRSMKDLVSLFDLFDRDGIALVFLDMNIDTSTSQGRLLRHIMAAFAEYESDVKSDYSKAVHRMMMREGRPNGPRAPFGYRIVGEHSQRTYVEDPQEAAVVSALFERYLAGDSLNVLAKELNDTGVRGPQGGLWSRQRVKTILDNPAYAGFRIYEGAEFGGRWNPLVTRRAWDAVKAKRRANRLTLTNPPGFRNHLLSGLLVCGVCNRNLHHGHLSDRGGIYRCTTDDHNRPRCPGGQIQGSRVEQLVVNAFFDLQGLLKSGLSEVDACWVDADLFDRRDLLAAAVEKVILIPRPKDNPHGRGTTTRRSVKIVWRPDCSLLAFGYRGATSTLTPQDQRIVSSKGKSWSEWRKAYLAAGVSSSTG